jgi:hypothetical protein
VRAIALLFIGFASACGGQGMPGERCPDSSSPPCLAELRVFWRLQDRAQDDQSCPNDVQFVTVVTQRVDIPMLPEGPLPETPMGAEQSTTFACSDYAGTVRSEAGDTKIVVRFVRSDHTLYGETAPIHRTLANEVRSEAFATLITDGAYLKIGWKLVKSGVTLGCADAGVGSMTLAASPAGSMGLTYTSGSVACLPHTAYFGPLPLDTYTVGVNADAPGGTFLQGGTASGVSLDHLFVVDVGEITIDLTPPGP